MPIKPQMQHRRSSTTFHVAPYEAGTAIAHAPDSIGDRATCATRKSTLYGAICAVRASVAVFLFLLAVLSEAPPAHAQRTAPTAPRKVSVTAGIGEGTLSWTKPLDDGGSAVLRYEVRHAQSLFISGTVAWTSVGLVTTYTVSDLAEGELHAFQVRAVNAEGDGPSARTFATTRTSAPGTAPTAPLGVSATPGDGQVTVNMSAPADEGSSLAFPEWRYSAGTTVPDTVPWTRLLTFGSGVTTVVARSLNHGTLYTVEVRAANAHGAGPVVRVRAIAGRPTAPRNLSATAGIGEVTLSWAAPADGGFALTRYAVRYAEGGTTGTAAWTSVGLTNTHTLTDLAKGTLFTFEVRAVNTQGAGLTGENWATTLATVPTAPREVSATAGIGEVALSWAAPEDDGGSEVLRYEVRHAQSLFISGTVAWTSVGLATTYTVSNLAEGELHAFQVRAVNAEGAGPSAPIHATTRTSAPGMAPTAPLGVSATPGDGQVTVNMSAPADEGSSLAFPEWRYSSGTTVPDTLPWTRGLTFGSGVSRVVARSLNNGTVY
ncbi:MAG: fibronectin type III domain-containing protein, partial [Deltaproteobacteria bacterium]|nr:fibronectin type III domain-containing protein [Deltaproteobacteria bacterium]